MTRTADPLAGEQHLGPLPVQLAQSGPIPFACTATPTVPVDGPQYHADVRARRHHRVTGLGRNGQLHCSGAAGGLVRK
jgi:hypothetical protein